MRERENTLDDDDDGVEIPSLREQLTRFPLFRPTKSNRCHSYSGHGKAARDCQDPAYGSVDTSFCQLGIKYCTDAVRLHLMTED